MKTKSVELMRDIREKISGEIKGMSWAEEREYLRKHNGSFDNLLQLVTETGKLSQNRTVRPSI